LKKYVGLESIQDQCRRFAINEAKHPFFFLSDTFFAEFQSACFFLTSLLH
jgi:hypothetical protein